MRQTEERKKPGPKPKRAPRVPMGKGLALDPQGMGLDMENYHHYWFQDREGRIDEALAAYYEFVVKDGHKVKRESGPHPLYLMRIEKKYWLEDQELHNQQIKDTLNAEQGLSEGEYIPEDRHHVLQEDSNYDPLA